MANDDAVGQIVAVLREGIEGPVAEGWSYYLDHGPDSGLRATLEKLSAEDASRRIAGNSIAAHVKHLAFSFEAFGTFIGGERKKYDWNESWSVHEVDEASWRALRDELSSRYSAISETIRTHAGDGEKPLGGAIGAAAHLAYHIGAIRQKLALLREAR